MSPLVVTLVVLVLALVVAVTLIVRGALSAERRRRLLDRLGLAEARSTHGGRILLDTAGGSTGDRRGLARVVALVPASMLDDPALEERLARAGFVGATALPYFVLARVAALVVCPIVALASAPAGDPLLRVVVIALGVAAGVAGPNAVVDRLAGARRDRVRRGVPDTLDLLVICVEAGMSLDAALARTAREMRVAHPDLSGELEYAVRRIQAGISREAALEALPRRTGVDELRTIVASLVQCERLGSSIARTLRVNADSLRLKRRQSAERLAAQAALKMVIPLALFLLPALLLVVLGPAVLALVRDVR